MRRRLLVLTLWRVLLSVPFATFVGGAAAASAAAPVEIASVIAGNNAFAFDMYGQLAQEEGNLFFSPYSVSTALAMTYAGARGETAAQMAKTLYFELAPDLFHPAVSELMSTLDAPGKAYDLAVANSLWGQAGYPLSREFLEITDRFYEAGLQRVDYTTRESREQARQTINGWVEEKTEEKIKDLLKESDLSPLTRLVLTNAIYFKGAWQVQFGLEATRPAPFHLLTGEAVDVPMMYQSAHFFYAENDAAQILEMPYSGDQLSMVVLLPREGKLPELEAMLDAKVVASWLSGLRRKEVEVFFPRFNVEQRVVLNEVLQQLGMTDAFSDDLADFSGMSGERGLHISSVIHQSFVEVNEEGAEAAAATAVIMEGKAASLDEPPVFRADRPFIFMIRGIRTGCILFMGRLADPRG